MVRNKQTNTLGYQSLFDIVRSIRKNNLYSFVIEPLLLQSEATPHEKGPDAGRGCYQQYLL